MIRLHRRNTTVCGAGKGVTGETYRLGRGEFGGGLGEGMVAEEGGEGGLVDEGVGVGDGFAGGVQEVAEVVCY